jgi:membrane protease YdiL (CAAX protease family)
MVTLLPRELAGLGGASPDWLPEPPVLDRALPAPPKKTIPAARWSPGQAFVVVLIATGALAFLQILLFALHIPGGQVWGVLWTIGACGLFLAIARAAATRLGGPEGVAAIGIRMPRVVDLVVGLAAGVGLYFVANFVQNWIFGHLEGWVGWYPTPPVPGLATDGWWIALGLVEVVVIAVGEESMFRGILYRGFRTRYPVALAIVIHAVYNGCFVVQSYMT